MLENPGLQRRRTLEDPGPSKDQEPKGPRTLVDSGSQRTHDAIGPRALEDSGPSRFKNLKDPGLLCAQYNVSCVKKFTCFIFMIKEQSYKRDYGTRITLCQILNWVCLLFMLLTLKMATTKTHFLCFDICVMICVVHCCCYCIKAIWNSCPQIRSLGFNKNAIL